jgi:hypothetical protein
MRLLVKGGSKVIDLLARSKCTGHFGKAHVQHDEEPQHGIPLSTVGSEESSAYFPVVRE